MKRYKHGRLAILITVLTGIAACGEADDRAATQSGQVQQALEPTPDVTTPIGLKWVKLGGQAVVGDAISEVSDLPEARGNYQMFKNGVIAYTNDFGAVYMPGGIFAQWSAGDYASLGFPTVDVIHVGSHDRVGFERGFMVQNDGSSATYAIAGLVAEEYIRGCSPMTSDCIEQRLGNPSSGLSTAEAGSQGDVSVQRFADGAIYADANGATALWGPILNKYETDELYLRSGRPTTSPTAVLHDTTLLGEEARLVDGSAIFSSASTGTYFLTGPVLAAYESRFGGPSGWLGFPLGDTGKTAIGDDFNDFEHGVIVNHLGGVSSSFAGINVFGNLSFKLYSAHGTSSGAGTNDTYVVYGASTSTGVTVDGGVCADDGELLCEDRDYSDASDAEITPNKSFELGVANSQLTVSLSVAVWDYDDTDPNDLIGKWHESHSINDLWGIATYGAHQTSGYPDDGAKATFGVASTHPYDHNDLRGQRWWSFRNFATDDISYDQFGEAFADAAPDDSPLWHPFNRIWYTAAVRNIAEDGNCFGMALESIYADRGLALFSHPIIDYFPDTQGGEKLNAASSSAHASLANQINLKHTYQMGWDMIRYYLRTLQSGATHSPASVFVNVAAALNAGHPMMIGLSRYWWGEGHAVRAYKTEEGQPCTQGGTAPCARIYIADPNYPVAIKPNVDSTYIEIDGKGHFHYSGAPGYHGDNVSGDRMYAIPFNGLLDHQPVTPFGLGQALESATLFIMGSDGATAQVTDGGGNTLFKPGIPGLPSKWDDLNSGPSGIIGMTPVPVFEEGASEPRMIVSRGRGMSHTYDMVPRPGAPAGASYQAGFISPYISATVTIPGTAGTPDRLTAHDINSPSKAISLEVPLNGVAKQVELTVGAPEKQRWARLSSLGFSPGQRVALKLDNGGYALVIDNEGPATTAELTVNAGPGATPIVVGTIEIPSGTSGLEFRAPKTTLSVSGQVFGNDGWLLAPVTVELSATDYSSKGIAKIEYRHDEAPWETYVCAPPGPAVCSTGLLAYADEGATTLSYRAMDRDQNLEVTKTAGFKIDTRRPVVTVSTDQAAYTRTQPFVAHFGASDPVPGSGLESVSGTVDGAPVFNGQSVDLLWFALGTHTVAVGAEDIAGWTASTSVTFEIIATQESLLALIKELRERGEIDSDGVENAFLALAVHNLPALLNAIRAQAGKHISQEAADLLAADVRYLIAH